MKGSRTKRKTIATGLKCLRTLKGPVPTLVKEFLQGRLLRLGSPRRVENINPNNSKFEAKSYVITQTHICIALLRAIFFVVHLFCPFCRFRIFLRSVASLALCEVLAMANTYVHSQKKMRSRFALLVLGQTWRYATNKISRHSAIAFILTASKRHTFLFENGECIRALG